MSPKTAAQDRTKPRERAWEKYEFEEVKDGDLTLYEKMIEDRWNKKRGKELSGSLHAVPSFSQDGKTIYLPDSVDKEDGSTLLKGMALLAHRLRIKVRKIPYGDKRKVTDVAPDCEKLGTGISFVLRDTELKFNINRKDDQYEYGRTFARAQQIIGAVIASKTLEIDCLKKNHRFFGNNPGELEGSGKVKSPVQYLARNLNVCFTEWEWAGHLTHLLIQLLRKSHVLVNPEIIASEIEDNCLGYSEAVSLYMTRDVIITPAQGKRPAVTKKRIPKSPKENALLNKDEMRVINDFIKPYFTLDYPSKKSDWVKTIKEDGWRNIKSTMVSQASKRSELLAKFASITTKRLTEARKTGLGKDKRKRDVTSTDVDRLLSSRENRLNSFVTEVSLLDPDFRSVLSTFRIEKEVKDGKRVLDSLASKRKLYLHINQENVYSTFKPLKLPDETTSGSSSKKEASKAGDKTPIDDAVVRELSKLGKNSWERWALGKFYEEGKLKVPSDAELITKNVGLLRAGNAFASLKDESERETFILTEVSKILKIN